MSGGNESGASTSAKFSSWPRDAIKAMKKLLRLRLFLRVQLLGTDFYDDVCFVLSQDDDTGAYLNLHIT